MLFSDVFMVLPGILQFPTASEHALAIIKHTSAHINCARACATALIMGFGTHADRFAAACGEFSHHQQTAEVQIYPAHGFPLLKKEAHRNIM